MLNKLLTFKAKNLLRLSKFLEIKLATKQVTPGIVRLCSSTTKGFNFNVYFDEDQTNTKYMGTISQDHKDDSCTCMGNTMGKNCKHIKEAYTNMNGYWL